MNKTKERRFLQRKRRARAKVFGTEEKPRLSVFRSNKYIYAQVINDEKGKTLLSAGGKKGLDMAFSVGETLAKQAKIKKIKKVVFDKGGYKYHGQIKAVAEGARKGGLEF